MNAARLDSLLLTAIAAIISVGALIYYYHQGAILLYGDAVAHINIARRVFDSRTPGLLQLGTVWLPLPHVLDIPFIVNDRMWQSGVGASIASMIAYVAGTLGVFRLVRGLASRAAAWLAALVYALNPNLIYMQATAMTEALYLALFVWAVVYFSEFAREAGDDPARAHRSLTKCGIAVSAAMLVRYDGWFLAAVMAVSALIVVWRVYSIAPGSSGAKAQVNFASGFPPAIEAGASTKSGASADVGSIRPQAFPHSGRLLRSGLVNFILLTGITAVSFLVYNQLAFGNALEFVKGPSSPRAIQERSKTPTMQTYPGENSPRGAALQFLKISRLNIAAGRTEKLLFTTGFVALLAVIYFSRKFLPWATLWTPVAFYVLCIAWGSVPIYHPEWWPFSYYNVRYGLQLLPAIAAFVALAVEFAGRFLPVRVVAAAAVLMVTASYWSVWNTTPVSLREAIANGRERMALEEALAIELRKLPASATIMMDCSAHSGAVQLAGIHFSRVLRESNPPFWETALTQPAQSADYVVVFPGDIVERAVQRSPEGLRQVAIIG
ncbi:MAG TPA: glycosyltransferase family 39 protein, partial [Candidatus Sulfotelmatobacter sp.]|nr:glycosyltransferase family 39 protein [Candidatus Sulfotelmatobacter sp.]